MQSVNCSPCALFTLLLVLLACRFKHDMECEQFYMVSSSSMLISECLTSHTPEYNSSDKQDMCGQATSAVAVPAPCALVLCSWLPCSTCAF
jgi:hypothetical protein